MRPMLATRGTYVPPGDEWQHEVKWDGVRILADVTAERGVRLFSRNENIVSAGLARDRAPRRPGTRTCWSTARSSASTPRGDPTSACSNPACTCATPARWRGWPRAIPATYMVFDLLRLDGVDLTRMPLHERRAALDELDLQGTAWAVPPAYDDGAMLHEATLEQGLEGMVSKRRASRYEFGARSKAWLKFAHRRRASFVVGGWRLETDSQNRIGALLVGEPVEGGGFIYRGRVGSGIAGAKARKLEEVLAPLARDTSPFSDEVPRVDAARHPVGGARAGGRRRVAGPLEPAAAAPAGVPGLAHRPRPGRPVPVSPGSQEVRVDVEGRTLKLSNLDKVYYPRTGTTKGEVLNYYAQVAPVMLPLLKDRAVTRVRWPNGVEQQSFFEKNTPAGTPSWVRTARVPTTGSRGPSRHGDELVFPIVDDLATLTWMVNLAAIELHVHQWTVTKAGKPRGANRLVIDLDPGEGAGLHECCRVALLVREKLAERNLDAEAVTSGSKGLHLYAALTEAARPRRLHGPRQGGRRGARQGARQARHRDDDEGPAVGEGVPRLVAEHRLQDHALAVLTEGSGAADRGHARHLERGRGRRRGPPGAGAVPVRGGAGAARGAR